MKGLLHAKLFQKDKLYGTTVVGTKGQIVIPAAARKDLKIKPGDKLLVISRFGRLLGLVKVEQLGKIVNFLAKHLKHFGEPEFMREFQKLPREILSSLSRKK